LGVFDGQLLGRLADDPILLANTLYAVCKPQADERGIDDEAFGELQRWLARAGSLPTLYSPAVISRLDYGWTGFIEARSATTATEEQALWQRTGCLLALLDLLNARDCHWQNVIVVADQPVLIDAEGVFHRPLLGEVPSDSAPESALSVLATGLTPYWKRDAGVRSEASGTGSPPPERIKHVLDGFSRAYRTLLGRQSELLDPDGPLSRFESVSVRTIFRDTGYYQRLMLEACTREALKSSDGRETALGKLVREHDDPRLAEVERVELAALRRLDVPRFTARVGGRAIDLDGRRVPGWFGQTGLDMVHQRVRSQCESELARKLDYLRAAYALAALEASF
jgi:lantibiotic modifying enzyme